MFALIAFLLLFPSISYAVDLAWDTPISRLCYQHVALESGQWTGIYEASDCPSDNPANQCSTFSNWAVQSPSNDKSCPLWFLLTENLSERDVGNTWNYSLLGGYGDPIVLSATIASDPEDACGQKAIGFEWSTVDRSLKDLSTTLGPNLANLADLTVSLIAEFSYENTFECSLPQLLLSVTVQYPNNHEDTLILDFAVSEEDDEENRKSILSTNYNVSARRCGTGSAQSCFTTLSVENTFRGGVSGASSKSPILSMANNTPASIKVDFLSLLKDVQYLPPPPSAYTYTDAKVKNVRFLSRIFGGTLSLAVQNMTLTGN